MGQWLCLPMIAGGIWLSRGVDASAVFAAVLPVFGLVACGYLAGASGWSRKPPAWRSTSSSMPSPCPRAVHRGLPRLARGNPERNRFLLVVILATLATAVARLRLVVLFRRITRRKHDAGAQCLLRQYRLDGHSAGHSAYGERAALPAALATVASQLGSFALAIVCWSSS